MSDRVQDLKATLDNLLDDFAEAQADYESVRDYPLAQHKVGGRLDDAREKIMSFFEEALNGSE